MTRTLTTLAIAAVASLALVADANAQQSLFVKASPQAAVQPFVQPPPQQMVLPKFGFQSFNLSGIGERVTYVQCHGLASQMGLEPGDIVISLNGFPLTYHGAWDQALANAMYQGGSIQLAIRDVRSGYVVYRNTFVGGTPGVGPITPKSVPLGTPGPVTNYNYSQPQQPIGQPGPITQKSVQGGNNNNLSTGGKLKVNSQSIKQLGQLLQIGG